MLFKLSVLCSFLAVSVYAHPVGNNTVEDRATRARVITQCKNANNAALTFDDGPYQYSYDISNALNAAGAKGTFFLNGNNYECIYSADNIARIKHLKSQGHQLASHTWAHKDLATLSWDQIHDEMWRVEQALKRIAGVVPAFMRPPFGSYNNLVREASYVRGQTVVIWDFDSGDSTGSTLAQSKTAYNQLASRRPSTVLTLNHETYQTTGKQLVPYAIQKLQAAGYKLVTVAECLGEKPYQSEGAPESQTSDWHC